MLRTLLVVPLLWATHATQTFWGKPQIRRCQFQVLISCLRTLMVARSVLLLCWFGLVFSKIACLKKGILLCGKKQRTKNATDLIYDL
jgi:hypothetical protein